MIKKVLLIQFENTVESQNIFHKQTQNTKQFKILLMQKVRSELRGVK